MSSTKSSDIGEAARSKVPLSRRLTLLQNYSVLFGWVLVFSSTFIGGIIAVNFPFSVGVPIILFGTLNNAFFGALIGAAAARTGFSNGLLWRYSYGRLGAVLPDILMSLTLIGWFAFILNITADAISTYFGFADFTPGYWVFWLLIGLVFFIPAFRSIKWMAYVNYLAAGGYIIVLLIVTVLSWQQIGGLSGLLAKDFAPKLPVAAGLTAAVGGWAAGSTSIADFSRFWKNGKQAFIGLFVGYGVLMSLQYLGGLMGGVATGQWNIFLVMNSFGLLAVGIIALFFGAWSTNTGCIYIPSLSMSAPPFPEYRTPEMTRRLVAIIAFIIAMIGSATGILVTFFNYWLAFLTSAVMPVAVTVVVDYWGFRDRRKMYEDGVRPEFAVNWVAVAAWVLAFTVGYLTYINNIGFSVLNGIVVTLVIYYPYMRWHMSKMKKTMEVPAAGAKGGS